MHVGSFRISLNVPMFVMSGKQFGLYLLISFAAFSSFSLDISRIVSLLFAAFIGVIIA